MKTRNNTKIRKTKKRNNHTRKMNGGFLNWFKSFSNPENKELNEDLNTFSTHKETIKKTMQSMYDNAKDSTKFNDNYKLFTTTVTEVNELVKQINKHRIQNTGANPGVKTIGVKSISANPSNTGVIGAIGVGAGVIGAGAEAIAGIEGARKELFGSPKLNSG